ncbi:MAG: hypothetical protein A2041_07635 [Bacteroidetes bacterium GWA2_31_9b]|nr:MAG: hypothetical protein A2041_07635 [Bacteroidetes bacterium GWA2_31_9b]
MKTKTFFWNVLISIGTAIITILVYSSIKENKNESVNAQRTNYSIKDSNSDTNSYHQVNFSALNNNTYTDFTIAAENSVNAVVHVTSKYNIESNYYNNPILDLIFGDGYSNQPVMSFGSGVIISEDGYIVTNYHVVEKSSEIEVILNDKRSFTAEVIGTDSNTDLALLKVKETGLPFIQFGNSDEAKVGEWVLAVGNPFNLTSTVTAGIVSAKARNINILSGKQNPLESYIQTDAAVNRGNSGGALVNLEGKLIGINSAILSPSGSYSGYSFAIPVNIVKKVIADLIKYGEVQRAVLGVSIADIDNELANKQNLDKIEGVYVKEITEAGAAEKSGMKKDDIILSINEIPVNSVAELTEQMGKYRPGETVSIIIKRENKKKLIDVELRNMYGNTKIVTVEESLSTLGATLQKIDDKDKKRFGIENGIKIAELKEGVFKKSGIKENFIITQVQGQKIYSIDDFKNALKNQNSNNEVEIEGTYPGSRYYYVFRVKIN